MPDDLLGFCERYIAQPPLPFQRETLEAMMRSDKPLVLKPYFGERSWGPDMAIDSFFSEPRGRRKIAVILDELPPLPPAPGGSPC